MRRRLLAVLTLTVLIGLPTALSPQPAAAASCTGWTSTRVPPSTIRVLRTGTGKVQTVDFKTYVKVVMKAEWPDSWETEALRVGAISVKQFGWYYTMSWRGGSGTGGCYDVVDSTSDQLYQPETRIPTAPIIAAVDATWSKTATKSGSFLLMGYRSGATVACGADKDGYHLYQHSVRACAQAGLKVDQILHVYFDPGVVIWSPAADPAGVFISPPDSWAVTVGSSATIAWAEDPADGTTIASRKVSLVMALPRNGSCNVDRWVAASPAWGSTSASPQTATGLKSGVCYKALLKLTDSNGATASRTSGTMYVDPAAPRATFTSPPATVTAISGSTYTVRWTETLASGATVVSRRLYVDRGSQPVAGTCAGVSWSGGSAINTASPYSSAGLGRLYCYRYRVVITDSAGHTGTTLSGVLMGPT
jgi:hypothetical protein